MSADRQYLSFGGGVYATALLLLLTERGEEFEAVFADHGADYPETYDYVAMLQAKGYPITALQARRKGLNLYDYCIEYGILPAIKWRWCTSHWKIKPLEKYMEAPAFGLLGIDAGEARRATVRDRNGLVYGYPLVEWGIDRAGCVEVIKRHGLPVPPKSGCFFCPFQRREQWVQLRDRHPELWCKALALESACVEKRLGQGKQPYYINEKPLPIVVQEDQGDLFTGFRQPCVCLL